MKAITLSLSVLLLISSANAKPIRASLDPVKDEPPITAGDRSHWAFAPLRMPAVPEVAPDSAALTDIDRFLLARLEAAGLGFSPAADAATMLRRLSFDLTGLPPSAEQRARFRELSGGKYERLVDELLASPQYGEAQTQPWLDLARYAETDGFEHDNERKHAWKYRDWVITALNRDMPFDEFARQQIAGDQIAGGDAIATGFLLAGPDMPDLNNQDERRHFVLNEITATCGTAFLGLTMGCAQCHDHPFDPVSQADFYRLRAFFDSQPEFKRDKQLGPEMRIENEAKTASHVLIRGDFRRPGPQVASAFPRIANPRSLPAGSERLALAQWITHADNALFLRVTANRIWQQHFGRGLAAISEDLGRQGEQPTHPELLDWLAAELPRQGWSLKKMHKLIVMSAAYRQASFGGRNEADEAGRLLASFPRRRLSGEELRDAMLAAAGLLNPKAGGPSARLPLPAEVSANLLKKQMGASEDTAEHDRRSIYTFARRNLRLPIFDLFDRPDALMSCSRRNESTTSTQALLLFNSEFSQRIANTIANRVLRQSGLDPESQAADAFEQILSRAPANREHELGTAFIRKQLPLSGARIEALSDYCLALLNSNAFLWVD